MTKMMVDLVIAKIRALSSEDQLTIINELKASFSEDDLITVEKLKASLIDPNIRQSMFKR